MIIRTRAPGLAHAVYLAHHRGQIGQVFEHVGADHRLEAVVFERPGEAVQVVDDVHARSGAAVNAHGPGLLRLATTQIKHLAHLWRAILGTLRKEFEWLVASVVTPRLAARHSPRRHKGTPVV